MKKKDNVISVNVVNIIVIDFLGSVEDFLGYVYNMYNLNFLLVVKIGIVEIKDK